jgi:sulfide:quinone oxidoreductase
VPPRARARAGAGFGGLELTTQLSEEFGDGVEVALIDKNDTFVFGFSKLDVMFGRTTSAACATPTATPSSRG